MTVERDDDIRNAADDIKTVAEMICGQIFPLVDGAADDLVAAMVVAGLYNHVHRSFIKSGSCNDFHLLLDRLIKC